MANDHATRTELDQLRAEFTAFRIGVEAERRQRPPRRSHLRRFLPLALAALLVALVPLATLAATPFTDLVPGSVHNANIDAIYTAGITTGCVPNAQYCPTDTVTRQEMASFLARTAGLGGNPPVANAKTAQTAANATTATNATHAASADTATTAMTATNAAQLGGVPAASYVQTSNHFLPIAFGTVMNNQIASGSGNVTVSALGNGHYQITIAGVAYDSGAFTTVATVIGVSGFIRTTSTRALLDVFTSTTADTGADRDFQFVVFKS